MLKIVPKTRKQSINIKDNLSETSAQSGDQMEKQDIHPGHLQNKIHQVFNTKAKSSLCKNFMEKGLCPYGNKCQFAHGPNQLKCNSDKQMSYKTRACHSFARKGYCCYGSRCNFLHQNQQCQADLDTSLKLRELLYQNRKLNGSRLLVILGSQ